MPILIVTLCGNLGMPLKQKTWVAVHWDCAYCRTMQYVTACHRPLKSMMMITYFKHHESVIQKLSVKHT